VKMRVRTLGGSMGKRGKDVRVRLVLWVVGDLSRSIASSWCGSVAMAGISRLSTSAGSVVDTSSGSIKSVAVMMVCACYE
jgi:hypothetical protein